MTVGVDRFAPYLGVFGSGVFEPASFDRPAPFASPVLQLRRRHPIKPLPAAPPPTTSIEASSPHLRLAKAAALRLGASALCAGVGGSGADGRDAVT